MKRILVFLVLLSLVASFSAYSASTRWNALGGEHRFIIDTTNYSVYPGRVTMFGNAMFIIPVASADIKEFHDQRYFDDNGVVSGLLVNMKNMTLGLHYNLNTAGTGNLRGALAGLRLDADQQYDLTDALRDMDREDAGSPDWLEAKDIAERLSQRQRLGALDLKEFPDLFWGMKMGKISLGARVAIAMDSGKDAANLVQSPVGAEGAATGKTTTLGEEIITKAMSLDVSLGASMYETPAGDLDLGLGIGMQSFSDDDPNSGLTMESTGGMDIAFNARLNKALDENYTLVPLLSVNTGSLPTIAEDEKSAPNVTEISYVKGDLGVGVRKKIKEKGFVLFGALGNFGSTTFTPTKGDETADSSLGVTVLGGCEFPVTKWLIVRGGANVKFSSVTDEMVVTEVTEDYLGVGEETTNPVLGTRKLNSVGYYYNTGIRMMYGGCILDVLFARNIFHRGPYILTGAGDSWATNICLTYAF